MASGNWQYLKYVTRHKWFVFYAGLHIRVPLWRLIKHDWSKFTRAEWGPYVNYFYGEDQPQSTVGSVVWVNCMDGFAGLAVITDMRGGQQFEQSHYRVKMLPAPSDACVDPLEQEFWAHDWEVDFNEPRVKEIRERAVGAPFDRAWLHHQHVNDHHWQHWILREDSGLVKCLAMPESARREMIADWMGAGRAITGKWEALSWYRKNREFIKLHDFTRAAVELELEMLAKVGMA